MKRSGVRTIEVASPSAMAEAGAVLRALVVIVCGAAIAMTAKFGRSEPAASSTDTAMLGVVPFRELPADDQRMDRNCLAGLTEAEDVRSTTGAWPTVEALAARGIPPFADDPLDGAGYRWTLLRDGLLVNYLGVPDAASGRPTLLIVALEPDPGTAPDPGASVDETHHRLRDGTVIHVSVSIGTMRLLARPLATPMAEDGWRRIVLAP